MPRASMNPDKAKQGGGVEAGNYLVTAAKYQNIKTDRRPNQLNLVLDVQLLDASGAEVRGADAVELNFSFGEKSLQAFHPGIATGPDDMDPQDAGDGVDAEGNTIYCSGDEQFNKSCGAMVFAETLVKQGFPKSELDKSWAPSFVGLKFHLETLDSKTVNERFGTRLSTKPTADGGTVTYKVCSKWLNPSYLGASGNGSAAGAQTQQTQQTNQSAAQTAGAGTNAAPAQTNGHSAAGVPTDAKEIAMAVLRSVATEKAGAKSPVKTPQSLVGFFSNHYTTKALFNGSKAPASKLAECQKLLKDEEWLGDAVAEIGGMFEYNAEGMKTGKITFPEPGV